MTTQITDGVITDASISSSKIADGAITAAKLAPDAEGGDIVAKVTSSLSYTTVVGDQTFTPVGNALAKSGFAGDITALDSTHVAVVDGGNDTIGNYVWDGTDFTLVGNSFSQVNGTEMCCGALTSTSIAVFDGTASVRELTKYSFDGTNWAQVGNSLAISNTDFNAMAGMSANRIAFIEAGQKQLRMYEFDGTNWAQVGNNFSISDVGLHDMCALTSTTIAIASSSSASIRKYSFDGTDWTQIGNSSPNYSMGNSGISSFVDNEVFVARSNNRIIEKWTFNGTDWAMIAGSSYLLPAAFTYPGMAAVSATTVAFMGTQDAHLRMLEFDAENYAITDTSATGELGVAFEVGSTVAITDSASNNGSHTVTKIPNANAIQVGTALVTEAANTSTATRTFANSDIIQYQNGHWVGRTVPLGFTQGTNTTLTSTTSIDLTGIPPHAQFVVISFHELSIDTDDNVECQLGTDAGFQTNGYTSQAANIKHNTAVPVTQGTKGFATNSWAAYDLMYGAMTFTLKNAAINQWVASHTLSIGTSSGLTVGAGIINLVGKLSQVRVTTHAGTANFDYLYGSSVNIMWQ